MNRQKLKKKIILINGTDFGMNLTMKHIVKKVMNVP